MWFSAILQCTTPIHTSIVVLRPIGFCTFKASKRQPDVAQPQLNTATFFRPCVKLDNCANKYACEGEENDNFHKMSWEIINDYE